MKKNVKLMLAFVAILTVVAAVLVVFGILRHNEPDLLHVVWSGGEVSAYFDEPQEFTEPLVWEKPFPLLVKVLNDDRAPAWRVDALHASIASFNRQVGCTIFRAAPGGVTSNENVDIWINLEAPREVWTQNSHAGSTRHYIALSGKMEAKIEIYGVPDMASALNAIEHELGHAVGLAHDNFVMSIMHPNAVTNSEFSRLTDHDKRTLRSMYCR